MDQVQTSSDPINVPAAILAGDFAGWLREAMEVRGISQRMLAHLSGIDHSTISRLLSDQRNPSLGTALALIRVLERPHLRIAAARVQPQG